tara:strand:- start:49 stop:363 length:315 start_codon:yes stop_codon:yes gene_type:complete
MIIKVFDAILSLNANAKVVVRNNADIDNCEIEWLDGTPEISKADIKTKMAELQTQYDNNQYQRDRAESYPSIQDQLDMQYWDKVNSTTTWQTAIAKVKSDNPKG